jgi:hypothetical protein
MTFDILLILIYSLAYFYKELNSLIGEIVLGI